ncbi:hypothetical protein, partial [Rathayibacter tanaceti]|uniref:hypothetical protein n=1 Tax=Rathayibacter tanaceti TaxID=1671680 RepID=UPI001F2A4B4E
MQVQGGLPGREGARDQEQIVARMLLADRALEAEFGRSQRDGFVGEFFQAFDREAACTPEGGVDVAVHDDRDDVAHGLPADVVGERGERVEVVAVRRQQGEVVGIGEPCRVG